MARFTYILHIQKKITSHLRNNVYNTLTTPTTTEYWLRKLRIPDVYNTSIAWDEIASAFSSLPTSKQIETVKWTSDFCGTGKNLQRWKEQSHSACPTCGQDQEDTHHILTCPHPQPTQQWHSSLQNLKRSLSRLSTAPDIINLILENLMAWRQSRPPPHYDGPQPFLQETQLHQTEIGWHSFVRGFVSHKWAKPQDCHYKHIGSKKTGKRWVSALIKKLWQVSWDMWRFRNGVLHTQSPTATTNFTFLLTSTIIAEKNHGHRLLPPKCTYLFHSTLTTLLRSSINNKKLWVATVWAARDLYSPADTFIQSRNPIVASFVEPWRKKIQRRR